MSSLVVGKLAAGLVPALDPVERQKGMIRAGEEIDSWMQSAAENDKDDFFNDIHNDVTKPAAGFKVFYFDTDKMPREITKSPPAKKNKKYEFTDSAGATRYLQVKIEEDEASETRMTIVVPRDRGDLIAAGYIPNILTDLEAIDAGGATNAAKRDMKSKYLLATIFLSRCQ